MRPKSGKVEPMRVISEEKLVTFMKRCVALSAEVILSLEADATSPPPPEVAEAWQALVADLAAERESDAYLQDESWNWIFDGAPPTNSIRLYGRLAWVNLQLLELI
jgi:hypothetical protein